MELTAEMMWKMLKDINLRELPCEVRPQESPCGTSWHIETDYEGTLSPREALALIVDAMKREMKDRWAGTALRRNGWEAWLTTPIENRFEVTRRHPTESEAVIAAYKAWRESK